MLDRQEGGYQESIRVLRCLAAEILDMDDEERQSYLTKINRIKSEDSGDRFWLSVARFLLDKPELGLKAFQFAEREMDNYTEITCLG